MIYLTAAFTGLRRGAFVALRWHDVDFTHRHTGVTACYTERSLTTPKSVLIRLASASPTARSTPSITGVASPRRISGLGLGPDGELPSSSLATHRGHAVWSLAGLVTRLAHTRRLRPRDGERR